MRTITMWKDFGAEGRPITGVTYLYRPSDDYELTSQQDTAIIKAWSESLKTNAHLTNGQQLNLRGIRDLAEDLSVVLFGPTEFRHYNESKEFLNGSKNPEEYGLSEKDISYLEEQIKPLSSFPSVFVEDAFLMGIKGERVAPPGAGKLSFPGAGYHDRRKDVYIFEGQEGAKHPGYIVGRETNEETATTRAEIEGILALGVVEDTYKGSHRNPGLSSIVRVSLTKEELKRRKLGEEAEDAWEHKGPYWFIPKDDPDLLSALIEADKSHGAIPLSEEYAGGIDGIGQTRLIDTTGKAGFQLFLLGRCLFGEEWFQNELDKHEQHLQLNYK